MAKLTVQGYEVAYHIWHEHCENTIVCLHGFTSSKDTWQAFAEHFPQHRIVAVDLMGHGETAAPAEIAPYAMAMQVAMLEQLFSALQLNEFTLVGYSMGGRVALSYAVQQPQRVRTLILESASPGLALEQERSARQTADEALAQRIEDKGLEPFVDQWENIPLFDTQKRLPQEQQLAVRQERLAQRALGLANSLRGIGTGVQPSNWHMLDTLPMPVLLITGELDAKFCVIAEKMQAFLAESAHIIIPDVGHAIHVENLAQFATIVKEAL